MSLLCFQPAQFGVIALLTALLLGCGCHARPKAPALTDDPVFESDEGFRFLKPEGWMIAARAAVPPGRLEKECLLVQYRRSDTGQGATLEVTAVDLPEDSSLSKYLTSPSFTVGEWKPTGSPEPLEVSGRTGQRFRFTGQGNPGRIDREVIAFRQGQRTYLFTLVYSPKDSSAPEQFRRAVRSIVWTK